MSTLKKNKSKIKNGQYEMGSTNVFADLDMPDAEEKLVKVELAFKINEILKKKKLKQSEAAKILESDQSKISLLARGRLSDFSIERLVKYLNLLNQDVDIVIKKSKKHSTQGELRVVYA